jgi:hypothetical protein
MHQTHRLSTGPRNPPLLGAFLLYKFPPLLDWFPKDEDACVVAWSTFEMSRVNTTKQRSPKMAKAPARTRVQRIARDLEDEVKEECDICHRTFNISKGGYQRHRTYCEWNANNSESKTQRPETLHQDLVGSNISNGSGDLNTTFNFTNLYEPEVSRLAKRIKLAAAHETSKLHDRNQGPAPSLASSSTATIEGPLDEDSGSIQDNVQDVPVEMPESKCSDSTLKDSGRTEVKFEMIRGTFDLEDKITS